MANYHLTVKNIARAGGKSCVSSLAYRSATKLNDLNTGQSFNYSKKQNVNHVEILTGDNAPKWLKDIAKECISDRQSALQKLSVIFENAEKRKDSQVYREIEFSLPRELTNEQNIEWSKKFINDVCVKKGMLSVLNFHFDCDEKTGEKKPHCHVLLSTRDVTEEGLSIHKRRDWNDKSLVIEWREQCAQYQNAALKEQGFETRVDHRSYVDRHVDIEAQPKKGKAVSQMTEKGIQTDKQKEFDFVKAANKFKILKNPEIVLSIVTANHSTFVRHNIAEVLNRYIDDPKEFQNLYVRLLASQKLVILNDKRGEGEEKIYTTTDMLKTEMKLVKEAENLAAQRTHHVSADCIEKVIQKNNECLSVYGGLSKDQENAIRHMLSDAQMSCVIGFAGTGKTTSLEAAKEAWEESGYKVVGIAPTGRASDNIEQSGIRSMTLHKFLKAQELGQERVSDKTIIVLDEAGMVDSRRFEDVINLASYTGAKIVALGDANQLQSVEAGPAFRLISDRINPAVLETVVRQNIEWQREATRLFGVLETDKALKIYQENGHINIIDENKSDFLNNGNETKQIFSFSLGAHARDKGLSSDISYQGKILSASSSDEEKNALIDNYCLTRQVTGHLWHEMISEKEDSLRSMGIEKQDIRPQHLKDHEDYKLYEQWVKERTSSVESIIYNVNFLKTALKNRNVDLNIFKEESDSILKKTASILRTMSYEHKVDMRVETKKALVASWDKARQALPNDSHLILAFTNKDANALNETVREILKERGEIKGSEFTFKTKAMSQDDFKREIVTHQKRSFAEGDRILFTHNDYGLGVKNGSLGTILALDQNKIKVILDGKDSKELSFLPNLYPYIDNGWATTIHKSQGVTVDHVKKLASYEEYRNLAYVGMSRHRKSVEVFGSNLDFWRSDKVIDRLSRAQEKLSGLDYIAHDIIQDDINNDHKILWHTQKIQQGKDFFKAFTTTAKDFFGHIFGKLNDKNENNLKQKELMKKELNPLLIALGEENRSKDIFKEKKADLLKENGKKEIQEIFYTNNINVRDKDFSTQKLMHEAASSTNPRINRLMHSNPAILEKLCSKANSFSWQREDLLGETHSIKERDVILGRVLHEQSRVKEWKEIFHYDNFLKLNSSRDVLKIENSAKRLSSIEGTLVEHNLNNNKTDSIDALVSKTMNIFAQNQIKEKELISSFEGRGLSNVLSSSLARSVMMIEEKHSISLPEEKMQSLEKSLAASLESISHIKPVIEKSLDILSLNSSEKIDVLESLQTKTLDQVTERFLERQQTLTEKEVNYITKSMQNETSKYVQQYQNYQRENQIDRSLDHGMQR